MLKIYKFFIFSFLIFLPYSCFSFTSNSVYNLNSTLIDHNGEVIKISDFSGKIQVFSMIYTRCKTICPVIISNMKSIEKLLPDNLKDRVNFFLISLDPDRDSVEILRNFFIDKKFNNDTWRLCKTDKHETLKIALTTGIKYKKEINNEYTHSNIIIILDKNGIIRMHHPGLDKNYKDILYLINSLS